MVHNHLSILRNLVASDDSNQSDLIWLSDFYKFMMEKLNSLQFFKSKFWKPRPLYLIVFFSKKGYNRKNNKMTNKIIIILWLQLKLCFDFGKYFDFDVFGSEIQNQNFFQLFCIFNVETNTSKRCSSIKKTIKHFSYQQNFAKMQISISTWKNWLRYFDFSRSKKYFEYFSDILNFNFANPVYNFKSHFEKSFAFSQLSFMQNTFLMLKNWNANFFCLHK